MKHYIFLTLALIGAMQCFGQWTTLNIPSSGRYDDVFFLDDKEGWAAGGNSTRIYHTTDGGETWSMQKNTGMYLRCIEFATPTLGFCGTLDSGLYKTTDGGVTWTDIANTISPKPPGICGLSAPTPQVIYGCGIWSKPAYVIKSADGGNTWTTMDLSAYASALVDIHFTSADTGFVSGKANPQGDGGIILYTTNGGNSWTVIHKTMTPFDYIWKMQTPDGQHFYGAIEAVEPSGNTRMLHSSDRGLSWNSIQVLDTFAYIQAIGFIDDKKGWIGGRSLLLETEDGGATWKGIKLGSAYNRFSKVNNHTAFLSGDKIYKYVSDIPTGIEKQQPYNEIHGLSVSPNPADHDVSIEITAANSTYAQLKLFSARGEELQVLYDAHITKGNHHFSASLASYPAQTFVVVLHTNEGVQYRKVLKR